LIDLKKSEIIGTFYNYNKGGGQIMAYTRKPYAGKPADTGSATTPAEPFGEGRGRRRQQPQKEQDDNFVKITRLFPTKKGNSYTVFLKDEVVNKLMDFVENSDSSFSLGVTVGEDGYCGLWGRKGDKR